MGVRTTRIGHNLNVENPMAVQAVWNKTDKIVNIVSYVGRMDTVQPAV